MDAHERHAYDCGRLAHDRGCYRVLASPRNATEEAAWLRGWDDARREKQRAAQPSHVK